MSTPDDRRYTDQHEWALVHGTDRPYAGPTDLALGPAFDHAVHVANPHHFLTGGTR